TGDGIITALQVLAAMIEGNRDLKTLATGMSSCPQVLINVEIEGRADSLLSASEVQSAVSEIESTMNGDGRVLLRPSGTEPLIRVMVEGSDQEETVRRAEYIAQAVRAAKRPN